MAIATEKVIDSVFSADRKIRVDITINDVGAYRIQKHFRRWDEEEETEYWTPDVSSRGGFYGTQEIAREKAISILGIQTS